MASNQDFTLNQYRSNPLVITVQDQAGNAVDLTNPTATMRLVAKVRRSDPDTEAVLDIDDTPADPDADPVNGVTVFNVLPRESADGAKDGAGMAEGAYYYDVVRHISATESYKHLSGVMHVTAAIGQDAA